MEITNILAESLSHEIMSRPMKEIMATADSSADSAFCVLFKHILTLSFMLMLWSIQSILNTVFHDEDSNSP